MEIQGWEIETKQLLYVREDSSLVQATRVTQVL